MTLFVWGVIGPLGLIVYWGAVFNFIVMDSTEPEQPLVWLVLPFVLPFLGGVLYFLFGRDWRAPVTCVQGVRQAGISTGPRAA